MSHLAYFLRPSMVVEFLLAAGLAFLVTWWLRRRLGRRQRQVLFLLFVFSVEVVAIVTLFREAWLGFCPSCVGQWSGLDKILNGELKYDDALNVALFVPSALLATLLWRKPWRAAGLAVLGSLGIEVVQPIVGAGANDLMDLLANTVGALVGVGAASVVLLVRDSIAHRRVNLTRAFRVGACLLVGATGFVAIPTWLSSVRQDAAVDHLQAIFGRTTLADYQKDRDTVWPSQLEQFWSDFGWPTGDASSDDTVARERMSWSIYFTERCVILEWTTTGFNVLKRSGAACDAPLELHD